MLRVCLLLGVATLLPSLACAGPLAFNNKLGTTVEVRPLDDPANPFRGQYGDWDRWIIEHPYKATADEPFATEDRFANYFVLGGRVDSNGWLLPAVEGQKLEMQWYRDSSFNPFVATYSYTIDGAGPIDEALLKAARTAFAQARAPYYPRIPGWLAKSVPEWSMILPDGRVVTQNWARGAWDPPGFGETAMPDAGQSGWQLYSAQGELIASTLPESWWWELTIPNFRELVAAYKTPTLNIIHKFGHIHVYDMDTRVTYANFDWDGTPLPANLKLHDGRDGVPFLGIHGFDLPIIYAAQQELARAAQSAPQAANSAP